MKKEEAIELIKETVFSYEEILANLDSRWFGEASPDEKAYEKYCEGVYDGISQEDVGWILLSIDEEYGHALEMANWY